MKWWYTLPLLLFCLVAIGLWQRFQSTEQAVPESVAPVVVTLVNEPIQAIPLQITLDEAKVKLGEKLFHDPRLSHNNSGYCWSTPFKVLGVLFLGEVCSAFCLPSRH